MDVILRNPCNIVYLDNPSEELQMVAVKLNRYSIYSHNLVLADSIIKYILQSNPDGSMIRWLKNISEENMLLAIKLSKNALQWITEPTEKAIIFHNMLWEI